MVDLLMNGNVAGMNVGGDIRSVIKNATKDPSMSESKDKTIMNKEEINKKKVAQNTKTQMPSLGGIQIGGLSGVDRTNINQTPKNTQTQTPKIQNNNIGGSVGMNFGSGIGGIGEISGIKVGSVNGEPTTTQTPTTGTVSNDEKMINSRGRLTALKDVVDVDSVLEDLYLDVGAGLKNGTLANVDVNNVKQLYSELAGLDDQVVLDLIADLGSLHQKGLPFNEQNLNKLKEGYPELRGVGRGFTTPQEQNMYQGGGFREAMNEGSVTDLNKYGAVGKVAETVVNPLGQATTVLDAAAQQIPQVTGAKMEKKLKDKLSSLTDEQIDKYYQRYKELTAQGKLKGYTTVLEGKNTVARLWNWVRGKSYQDVEGGFRNWLIDQVNADVNGYGGYLFGVADDLTGVGGPNVAKMITNIPASTAKTVTAITRAMTNPLDTLSGLGTLIFTDEGHQALKARYGSRDAIAKAMEQDPVGMASDVLAIAEGGAGIVKGATKLGKLGTKGASLATYALGAERTSESLLKLANRLEKFEGRMGGFKTAAGGASDLGIRKFIYGEELANGTRKGGLINALEQRASEGDSLTNKAAGYLAKTQQPLKTAGEVVKKTKEAGGVTGRIAQKITGSATAEDKLFQAANPNINRLTRGVDYKNKRANMDLANKAIIEAGYTPKNTAERVVAHLETLNKRWKEFTDKVKGKADVDVSSERLAKVLEDHINAAGKNITENQRSDINALQKEIKSLKGREKFNMIDLEDYKENINADTRNKTQTAKSDIYIRGMKKLSEEIGKIQNEILSNAPDEVKNLKRTIGALLDTKDDVIKANVKNLKKKEGGGLVESYSRIQGVADIVGGGLSILSRGGEGVKDVAKGVGKVVLGKALGKAKDVDWLTKQGFEGLRKKYEGKGLEGGRMEGKSVETKGTKTKKGEKGLKFQKGEEGDYDKALSAAYRKGERKNKVLSESEQKRVKGEIEKKAKNAGFVTKLFDNMVDAVKKSGGEAKEGDIIHGFTNIKDKVIALSKNPLDTTAQHELFHAVFDVVDKKSKGVVLGEAKKFLEEKLGKAVSDSIAEEWLAESFGIYMRDKMIDLGIIDKAKGIAGLKQKVEKLFQRGYEWMQNYNADRFLINDFFNAMREGKGLNKKGTMDLSYLRKNKGIEGKGVEGNKGLKYQKGRHGSPAEFKKFDSSHMGEGEGNQAHGRGHYVAVSRDTAKKYAEMRSGITYKGRELGELATSSDIKDTVAFEIIRDGNRINDYGKAKENLIKTREQQYNNNIDMFGEGMKGLTNENVRKGMIAKQKELADKIQTAKELDVNEFKKLERNLYELDIPDPEKRNTPTGKNYIDEKETITQAQKDKFLKEVLADGEAGRANDSLSYKDIEENGDIMFAKYFNTPDDYGDFLHGVLGDMEKGLTAGEAILTELRHTTKQSFNPKWSTKSAHEIFKAMGFNENLDQIKNVKTGRELYDWLANTYRSQEKASKLLEKMGYDGIHYVGGTDGEAYVIFKDQDMNIKDHIKYQKDSSGKQLSEGQQEYFKDSKVVDDKGRLLEIYHATPNNFTVFDRKKIGSVTNNKGIYGEGFYFTSNKDTVGSWTRRGAKLMKGYLDIKKPFMWSEFNNQKDLDKWLKSVGLKEGFLKINNNEKSIFNGTILPIVDEKKQIKFREVLEKNGYDGVRVKYKDGTDEIMAMNSNQFKNIDNLNPTKNEDIRFQTEGGKGLTPKKKKKGLQLGRSALVHRGVRYKDKEEK